METIAVPSFSLGFIIVLLNIKKTTNEIENGFPFTIGNVIYLSDRFLNKSKKYQLRTLIHEKLHIYQRKYSKETEKLYENHKFNKVTKIKDPMRRHNPDLDEFDYEYKGMVFYKKFNKDAKDLTDSYINYYIKNDKLIIEMKEKKYDDEHPNEIFANIISKQITKNNLNNRIKNYLN